MNTGKGYNGFAADVWSCGICLFAMLAGFFPLDEAKEADWRFRRFLRAEAAGQSVCAAIYGFYGRQCPFSADAVHMVEGMLRANPFDRLRVDELLAMPWLRRNCAPRLRALIELTLNPVPLSFADAERMEELLRPHSAPARDAQRTAEARAPGPGPATSGPAPGRAEGQAPQSGFQTNLGRAYAALTSVVSSHPRVAAGGHSSQPQPAGAPPSSLDRLEDLARAARAVDGAGAGAGADGCFPIRDRDSRKRRPQRTPPEGAVVEVPARVPASSSGGAPGPAPMATQSGGGEGEAMDIEAGQHGPVYRAMSRNMPPKIRGECSARAHAEPHPRAGAHRNAPLSPWPLAAVRCVQTC